MYSLHTEYDLVDGSGYSETQLRILVSQAGASVVFALSVPAGIYKSAYGLAASMSLADNAPEGWACEIGADGYVTCSADCAWRPYLLSDEESRATHSILWTMLGFDVRQDYPASISHKAQAHPAKSAWIRHLSEFAPESRKAVLHQGLGTHGDLVSLPLSNLKTCRMLIDYADDDDRKALKSIFDLAADGQAVRMYYGTKYLYKDFMISEKCLEDSVFNRTFSAVELYSVELELIPCPGE